eukprot:scaffold92574_cov18-Tisochrysis_lutea.AAC.2
MRIGLCVSFKKQVGKGKWQEGGGGGGGGGENVCACVCVSVHACVRASFNTSDTGILWRGRNRKGHKGFQGFQGGLAMVEEHEDKYRK